MLLHDLNTPRECFEKSRCHRRCDNDSRLGYRRDDAGLQLRECARGPSRCRIPDQGRLIAVQERSENAPHSPLSRSPLHDMRRRQPCSGHGGVRRKPRALRDDNGAPEQIPFGFVSASIFRVLGVEPALGRVFTDKKMFPRDRPLSCSATTCGSAATAAIPPCSDEPCRPAA
jgi:hypothetical protein